MECLLGKARDLFEAAIYDAYPHLKDKTVLVIVAPVLSKQAANTNADLQCNSAMPLVKTLSQHPAPVSDDSKPTKPNPVAIAESLIASASKLSSNDESAFENFTVSRSGFINFCIKKQYIESKISEMLRDGVKMQHKESIKVIVDYSSPNIAKEMHVGHLRSTIIGDSVARLLEYIGCDVMRLNHVGDWGTQFGMLLALLFEKFGEDQSKFSQEISSLQSFYKEAKVKFDTDEGFKKKAYECVIQLQSKEPKAISAWQKICDVSRREFQIIYDRLGIENLIERGESFYHDKMKEMVAGLEERGLLELDDGRKIFWPAEDKKLIPLTIVKSDGGYTYDTSDLAAVRQRVNEEHAKRIIYVTDTGQSAHFQSIFACAKRAGYCDNQVRLDHVGFGLVLGEDRKKFKTRSGDTVKLAELLDEGLERSLAKLQEKGRQTELTPEELTAAQEAVAYGCIKYADLSRDRNRDYVFSFDQMLDDKGNTAVYLLYCVTRIRSIARKANLGSVSEILHNKKEPLALNHPREIKLAKFMLRFPDIVMQCAEDLYFHSICGFLYELSTVYSEFYDECYCIERSGDTIVNINLDRILLCEATAMIMEKGLNLLGIKTVSRM
ncbi:Arginine--tRNA ligase, cytoplasmic, partial [Fragariocoptes setiger]